ncbi:MAG: polysaccharide deacetylase family protein [Peptococcaceae bacterium]|nr:polysaccharide deacetylase family protein [Peptococcaceae bacterium]
MRVYFFPKWLIQTVLIALCGLLAAGILWWFLGNDEASVMAEPVYQGNTAEKKVALAINVDWGEDIVPSMLDTLTQENVKATFFVTGRFAEKFPELVQQIYQAGHEIGNHGYKHPHPDQLSVEQNQKDIVQAEKVLEKLTEEKPILYAPPYGERGKTCLQAAEECGYTTILWTLDTVDWEKPAPSHETLVERAAGEKLEGGAIILMHPKEHTAEALPDIIKTIKGKGYQCVKVSEVL